MFGVLGEKVGMTAVFTEDGSQVPVTVVRTRGNQVVGKRTTERDGYTALVLGYGEKRAKRASKPEIGQFAKNDLVTEKEDGRKYIKRHVREFRIDGETLEGFEVGAELQVGEHFQVGDYVDVVGTSKGRGFSGVMKRHNFKGFKASHGVHEYFRHGGSIGMCTTPARVFKNKKMPGQQGNSRTTLQNLSVVDVIPEDGVVLIRGGIPGAKGSLVMIKRAVKKRRRLV